MNTVLRAAADSVQMGWLLGLTTVLFVFTFVAWTAWAWAPFNRKNLEEAARLPLDDGGGE